MVTYLFSTYFWPTVHPLFIQRVRKKNTCSKKIIPRNALLMEMKSRKEGFKSISSDASSICPKTSSKLFLAIDILHLVHCFKICFKYVLPVPMESSVNSSNKHVFVRRNCMEYGVTWDDDISQTDMGNYSFYFIFQNIPRQMTTCESLTEIVC